MEELENLFANDGIEFNAVYARRRCLPHTVHLAALKVSNNNPFRIRAWHNSAGLFSSWKGSVHWLLKTLKNAVMHIKTLLLPQQNTMLLILMPELTPSMKSCKRRMHPLWMLSKRCGSCTSFAVFALISTLKLRKIIRAIRSSPQRRKQWHEEVDAARRDSAGKLEEIVKMVILDVRTRWASTHQMCGMFLILFSA